MLVAVRFVHSLYEGFTTLCSKTLTHRCFRDSEQKIRQLENKLVVILSTSGGNKGDLKKEKKIDIRDFLHVV